MGKILSVDDLHISFDTYDGEVQAVGALHLIYIKEKRWPSWVNRDQENPLCRKASWD